MCLLCESKTYVMCSRTIWSLFFTNSTSSMEELVPGWGYESMEWGHGIMGVWVYGNETDQEVELGNELS